MISTNEQSADGDIDVQSIVCQADPHQVESRFTTIDSIESVQIDSVPQLSQVSQASGAVSHADQLPVVPDARLSRESSVSALSDTRYSVVSPQDSGQSQAPFVEGNSAALAISSAETGIRTDRPLDAMGKYTDRVSVPNDIAQHYYRVAQSGCFHGNGHPRSYTRLNRWVVSLHTQLAIFEPSHIHHPGVDDQGHRSVLVLRHALRPLGRQ